VAKRGIIYYRDLIFIVSLLAHIGVGYFLLQISNRIKCYLTAFASWRLCQKPNAPANLRFAQHKTSKIKLPKQSVQIKDLITPLSSQRLLLSGEKNIKEKGRLFSIPLCYFS
jgi:hypothetical protein